MLAPGPKRVRLISTYLAFQTAVGYHPTIVTFDVNRKCVFNISDIKGNEDTNVKECVNIDRFWSNVEMSCIYDSFGESYANTVIPTLDFWSPWIPERTRGNSIQ